LDHSLPLQSGYVYRTLSIVAEQRRLGWDVVLLTTPKHTVGEEPVERFDGWEFYRTPAPKGPGSGLPLVGEFAQMRATTARLAEVVAEKRPDILHAHSPALNGVPALRIGRRFGLPVVYELRAFWEDAAVDHGTAREGGPRYRAVRALESYVVRRAGRITVICEGIRGELIARGVADERITVIPNAVDVERFPPDLPRDQALADDLGVEGKTVLGFLGSFYGYEGLPFLVGALAKAVSVHPELVLLLVGGGPDEERIKAEVARHGLERRVLMTGRVPQSEVTRYYGLVDILVYPRLSKRITELVTPLKPLEGMAQRKLVLASDVGGHRELIVDGKTGFLFKADDADSLVARLGDLLAARDDWERLRDCGRRYVTEERNWRNSVARYRGVYEPLLAERARA
jgi:PEP-CTERM/exosortase A-associated glycosyltransferase